MYFFGFDPGAGGGAAMLSEEGRRYWSLPMPTTYESLWLLVSEWCESADLGRSDVRFRKVAVLEKVGGYMPGGGGNIGSRMFNFGASYGALRMALTVCKERYGLELYEVTPAVWQKKLGVVPRGKAESKPAFKKRLKELATSLFPGGKVTLKTADAFLLAEYGRMTYG